jgi:hypothetical protein
MYIREDGAAPRKVFWTERRATTKVGAAPAVPSWATGGASRKTDSLGGPAVDDDYDGNLALCGHMLTNGHRLTSNSPDSRNAAERGACRRPAR